MSRFHSYLNSAQLIIKTYDGGEPLSSFLKKFFASDKKYGSKDRRGISHLCYSYYRAALAVDTLNVTEQILACLFLCSKEPNEFLGELKPEWNDKTGSSAEEKFVLLDIKDPADKLFPWMPQLSYGIEHPLFAFSHLQQPDLFVRIRPGYRDVVLRKIQDAGYRMQEVEEDTIRLENGTRIEGVIEIDKEAVVQDLSSQTIGKVVKSKIYNLKSKIDLWDCCAGSGGKSIMLYDLFPGIDLTVSDKRESILSNLEKRFSKADIRNYQSVCLDLATRSSQLAARSFDLVNADVPCTGSGTWSRTPEQLFYFNEKKIEEYAGLQRKIVSNVIPNLKPGGWMIYSTCSVFKNENEAIVSFMQEKFNLQSEEMQLLNGYDKKADSMFVAVLRKPL